MSLVQLMNQYGLKHKYHNRPEMDEIILSNYGFNEYLDYFLYSYDWEVEIYSFFKGPWAFVFVCFLAFFALCLCFVECLLTKEENSELAIKEEDEEA